MNTTKVLTRISLAAALACAVTTAQAQLLFDNTSTYLNRGYTPATGVECGDEIILDTGTLPAAQLSGMSFEYFNSGGNGNERVSLRFYNMGQDGKPGTLVYDSGLSGILPTGRHVVTLNGLNVTVNKRFTWTALFTGVEGAEAVGFSLYSPPSVGQDFQDFWEYEAGTWTLKSLVSPAVGDFGATFNGTAVPEPGTIAWLGVYGVGAVLLAVARQRKRR
jgi:hypothetical protein